MLTSCDAGGLIEISVVPDGDGGGTSGTDAGPPDATVTGDIDASTNDAGVSPVLVAITPTAAGAEGAPSPADALAAELTTFGAGVRAAVIVRPWDTLAEGEDLALSKKSSFYAQHGKRVVVNLAVVDRLVDHRPASLAGTTWSSQEAVKAIEATIDTLFASSGPEVRFITLGRDVDVYLAAHPDERSAFVAFTKQAFAHARAHADAPDDLAVGVAFSADAPEDEPAFGNLRDLGDAVAFSYFPGLLTFDPAKEPSPALVVSQLATAAGDTPIVLQAAGFASDEAAGGSEDQQAAFVSTLFGAIGANRKSFALVNLVELFDAPTSSCAAWAAAQGEKEDGPLTAYACSLGALRADGSPKPAWNALLLGAAALSSP